MVSPAFPVNSGISVSLITKYCAIAVKRDVLKLKHQALPCIVSCWSVTGKVAVPFSLKK